MNRFPVNPANNITGVITSKAIESFSDMLITLPADNEVL